MAQLQLTDSQIRDLQLIRDLEGGVLRTAFERLAKVSPPPLRPTELFVEVKRSVDDNESIAVCLMRQCLSLNGLMRQAGINIDTLISGVRFGIEQQAEWTEEQLQKWDSVEPIFRELLSLDAFRIVATSIDLSYEYANLYRRGRILTDIRPLFTKDADAIQAAIVSFTLRLRYESVDGDHELSIAMDESDIREFAKQCERALKKAITARDIMKMKIQVPTIVTGEQNDE